MLTEEIADLLRINDDTEQPHFVQPTDTEPPNTAKQLNTDQAIDALKDMHITGCGTGRRIHMLMDPDDWTTDEITEKIRDAYPEPTELPLLIPLPAPIPYEPLDTLIPETCTATRQTVPDPPPPYPSDIPDETEEQKVIAVATELEAITPLPNNPKIPDLPNRLTAALRRATSALGKPIKDGTAPYWNLLAQAIAGIAQYLTHAEPTVERDGWAQLLIRINAQLEAARTDPYAGLPPLPFFWPAPPAGFFIQPITPIYQAPPMSSIALARGSYGTEQPHPKITRSTTVITLNTPPPGLSDKDAAAWMKAYAWPPPPKEQ